MRKILYPYKVGSASSKQLKERLGGLQVYPDRNYRNKIDDLVINWGNSKVPNWMSDSIKWLNKPSAVGNASNKLKALQILSENNILVPLFKDNPISAGDIYGKVVVRHKLDGHSGEGIEIFNTSDNLPVAPLYTRFIPARAEYRVHVFDGNVIDMSKKVRLNPDEEEFVSEEHRMVKSHQNGWTFARGGIKFNTELGRIAIKSIQALGLDFGAVDIIRGEDGEYYVLECNTACGMADSTENSYVNAILNYELKIS